MFSYEIKIPKDRIAVLIGTDGETKQEIEETLSCELTIDSGEGDVQVAGEDAVKLFSAQTVVKAIARGFNPDIALSLRKQDWAFELIDLNSWNEKRNHQERMKGRVIGKGGKARKTIEELSDSKLSIYGKTIGIIAPIETIGVAKQAVTMLLEGANHSTVFSFLERKKREIKRQQLMGSTPRNASSPSRRPTATTRSTPPTSWSSSRSRGW